MWGTPSNKMKALMECKGKGQRPMSTGMHALSVLLSRAFPHEAQTLLELRLNANLLSPVVTSSIWSQWLEADLT